MDLLRGLLQVLLVHTVITVYKTRAFAYLLVNRFFPLCKVFTQKKVSEGIFRGTGTVFQFNFPHVYPVMSVGKRNSRNSILDDARNIFFVVSVGDNILLGIHILCDGRWRHTNYTKVFFLMLFVVDYSLP